MSTVGNGTEGAASHGGQGQVISRWGHADAKAIAARTPYARVTRLFVGREKVQEGAQTILHPITNFTVSYVPATDAIEIAFTATETFATGGQITVLSGVTTATGGTLTRNAVFTISKGGKSVGPS